MAKQLTASWNSCTAAGRPVRFDPISSDSSYQTIRATVRYENEDGTVHLSTEVITVRNGSTRSYVEYKFNRCAFIEVEDEFDDYGVEA